MGIHAFLNLIGLRGFSLNVQKQLIPLTFLNQLFGFSVTMLIFIFDIWYYFNFVKPKKLIHDSRFTRIHENVIIFTRSTCIVLQIVVPYLKRFQIFKVIQIFERIDKFLLISNNGYLKKRQKWFLILQLLMYLCLYYFEYILSCYAISKCSLRFYISSQKIFLLLILNLVPFLIYLTILKYCFNGINKQLNQKLFENKNIISGMYI